MSYSREDEFMKAFVRVFGGVKPQPPKMPIPSYYEAWGCFVRRINKRCAWLKEDTFANSCCSSCPLGLP